MGRRAYLNRLALVSILPLLACLFLVAAWFMPISLYEMNGLSFCGPIQEAGGEYLRAAWIIAV